ncbi:DUF192 domain-containing protein [Candidatus Woesebacteria bacterium]|nr:DUF192 domain-containing protein [Candidatus Woesebacteria bacterium]
MIFRFPWISQRARFFLLLGVVNIVVIVLAGFLLFGSKRESSVVQPSFSDEINRLKDRQQATLMLQNSEGITKSTLTVEIVRSPKSLETGLSNRAKLQSDGMLFILPERQVPRFWMKQMLFDLDMVWIDGDRISAITPDAKAPADNTPLSDLPIYSPDEPVTLVLEVPAGNAEKLKLQIGDQLQFGSQ